MKTPAQQQSEAEAMDPTEREISSLETSAWMLDNRYETSLAAMRGNEVSAAKNRERAAILRADLQTKRALTEFADHPVSF